MLMILGLIILIIIGVIAFFHWVQGLFSATISAICAVLAACLAVSYHETLVDMLLKGKMADQANAMMLCVLFAAIYIILRVIFDKAVPGNLRFPALPDHIGGGVMGVIVGIFATGIFVLAGESLPYGPSFGGYSRYPLKGSENVVIPTERQQVDTVMYDAMSGSDFDPAQEKGLLIPVDDIVLGLVQHLSDNGSLAGDRTLASIHPDYPQELFGQRIGIQVGAKHTAPPLNGVDPIKVAGVYTVPQLAAFDPEYGDLHKEFKVDPTVRPKADEVLLVLRITVNHDASDDADSVFRFSTGSVRLVANDTNYYPIGTVDGASNLFRQKPDDFLFLKSEGDAGFDVAFLVKKQDLVGSGAGTKGAPGSDAIKDGTFVEVKRFARVDLGGKALDPNYIAASNINVMRKKLVLDKLKLQPPAATPAVGTTPSAPTPTVKPKKGRTPPKPPSEAAAPAPAAPPIAADSAKVSATISVKIGVTTIDENAQNLAVAGGTVSLKSSKFSAVVIDPSQPLDKLAQGDNQLSDVAVPDGKKLVQINGAWPSGISSMRLVDANGNEYAPNGLYTVVTNAGKQGLFMRYNVDQTLEDQPEPAGMTPATPITFLFLVPAGTQLKQVNIAGQQVPVSLMAQ
jgi:hypothetical protein